MTPYSLIKKNVYKLLRKSPSISCNNNTYIFIILPYFQDASSSEIRRAYRKKSKELHPDRNDAENAEAMFRQVCNYYVCNTKFSLFESQISKLPNNADRIFPGRKYFLICNPVVVSLYQKRIHWGHFQNNYISLE